MMEYTIQKLAQLAGISTRTLRYYDQIGLLCPARTNASGYRIYGTKEVDVLQQILFYKEMGLELAQIKEAIHDADFDSLAALHSHLEKNEQKYGKEVREKYGDKVVDQSNTKMMGLTEEQYTRMQKLGEKINLLLEEAVKKVQSVLRQECGRVCRVPETGGRIPYGVEGSKSTAKNNRKFLRLFF